MTLVLRYTARSDRGLVRSNNEDSVYAGARLLALADGMGGHAAGEVASQLVIQALRPLDDDEPGGDLLGKLEYATANGNDAIADEVSHHPELDGMGTTLTAILFAGSRIGLCHIGDSRGYLLRDGVLTQITRDDTFVQTLVEEGRITPEEAHTHPQRSLIMRALTGTEVEPTLTIREARAGDRYLLCSDGLSDVVSEETIADTLSGVKDHRECADRLIELALRGGGPDNVTVVVADVVDVDYGDSRPIIAGAVSGEDDDYQPDPNTAAGRAAALRPPPEPRKPVVSEPEPEPHRSSRRKWVLLSAAVVVVVVLIGGVFATRHIVASNYFTGVDDGNVVVYRGLQGSLLGIDTQKTAYVACVDALDTDDPQVRFVSTGDAGSCSRMRLDDIISRDQSAISGSQPGGSLSDAEGRVRRATFKEICPTPTPAPAPATSPRPGEPATSPRPGEPATTPVPPGTPAPTTAAPSPAPTGVSVTGDAAGTSPTSGDLAADSDSCRQVR
ncbi:protein phosphatase 2C domain-containing protein [Gordonia jinhuaensis]|uniref:Serine/threonine protein phosphatase PstP n=1 Tax=Gordonia jinhuaensis TaxID=1517702 RepID=A0A916TI72_9ACTN|nr:PP2C family serine/threonine-protein phosphatase [Gordonia jinhuaensis]GGB46665.1 serine/threonine protein phosphatase [Gordonia jinhuaensis]